MATEYEIALLQDKAEEIIHRLGHKIGFFQMINNPLIGRKVSENKSRYTVYEKQSPNMDYGAIVRCRQCSVSFRVVKLFKGDSRVYGGLKTLIALIDTEGNDVMIKYQIPKRLFCIKYQNLT